jgi:hypothetical protein
MALMDSLPSASPPGMALATSAILTGLFDALIAKGTLNKREIAGVFDRADAELNRFSTHIAFHDASVTIKAFQYNAGL